MARLQRLIDRSASSAGSAIRRNFVGGGWAMSAAEFVAFWGQSRMASVATADGPGNVHAAPLDVRLLDGVFYIATFPDSRRLHDHLVRPRCAITAWDGPYRAAIIHGDARRVDVDPEQRTVAVASEQGYEPPSMVTIAVTPTRIYGIRPPANHPATPVN